MLHFACKILPLLLLFSACKNAQSPDNQLSVSIKMLSLRAEPNEKSQEISSLNQGASLQDLDEVSQHEAQIVIGGQLFQSPWIKVKSSNGKEGWVLASGLSAASSNKDWLLQKRLRCYFGPALTERRNALLERFESMQNEEQMLENWRSAQALRDTFAVLLSGRSEQGFQPAFDWLKAALPAFIYQKMEHEQQGQLWADLQSWHAKALKTKGIQDDQFFQTCLVAFSADSIEAFYPAWKFQLSEANAASQLGTGQHRKMLLQIDVALQSGDLFRKELDVFKEQVLEDIFSKNIQYWQSSEKILSELGLLIQQAPSCLSPEEVNALQIRKKMFEDPVLNGIKVNLRSGE